MWAVQQMDGLIAMGVNLAGLPGILNDVAIAMGVAVLVLAMALVAWIVLKHYVWRARRAVARKGARRERTRPDGLPYPPTGMGICSECETAGHDLFHLPSGRRLCKECYDRIEGFATDSAAPRSRT